jgi:hypothetical protein
MFLTHLRISHSLQVEKIPKRFPWTQKNINWVIDHVQSCKWASHLHILWNFWRNCVKITWSSTKKIHTTLSVVEQLHSDVPAFCNSIPNLLYCALISIRSLQKPDAESHHGHDANQSQAIIILIIYFNLKLFCLSQFCLVKETLSTTINFSHWHLCFESNWREIWCTPAITTNNVLSGVLCQLQEFIWRKYLHMKEVHLVTYYTIMPRGHLMSTIFSHPLGLCTVQMSYPLAIY